MTEKSPSKPNNSHLIEITLQIAKDEFEAINIYEEDDIEAVVFEFCQQRGYSQIIQEKIMEMIALKIDENIENISSLEAAKESVSNNIKQSKSDRAAAIEENYSNIELAIQEDAKEEIVSNDISEISEINPYHNKYNIMSDSFNHTDAEKSSNPIMKRKQKKLEKHKVSKSKSKKESKSRSKSNKGAIYTENKDSDCKGGERLYNNFMKKQKKKKSHIEKLIKLKEEKEMKEATFTPFISKSSRDLLVVKDDGSKVEDRLLKFGTELSSKIENMYALNKMKQYDNSYSPEINERSKELAKKIKEQRRFELMKEGAEFSNSVSFIDENCKGRLLTASNCNEVTNLGENHLDSREEMTAYVRKTTKFKQTQNSLDDKPKSNVSIISSSHVNLKSDTQLIQLKNNKKVNSNSGSFIKDKSNLGAKQKEFSQNLRNNYRSENNNRPMFPRMTNKPADKSSERRMSRQPNKSKDNTFTTVATIHDELYFNTRLINKKAQKEMDEYRTDVYPFKPKINKPSCIEAFKTNESQTEVIERLYNSKKVSDEKYIHALKVKNSIKPTFQPLINKSRSISPIGRRDVSPSLNDFYGERIKSGLKNLEKNESNFKKEADELWKKEAMKKIAKIKIIKAKEIFDKLDSDRDGFISIKKIKFTGVDHTLISFLSPVLEELQQLNTELSFKEFFRRVYSNFDLS